ncbi:MAG: deoxyribose-phosphate aldolase [Fusobacteriaceae bacterium]|jgi:deoxyribose-phosphate aldolase|nr:deoxyribose-phosphate aldolase [Fusobacteriaceae bacterium]
MTKKEIAAYIDHTNLKPEATKNDILTLCEEAKENRFASVCIQPVHVALANGALAGSGVKVCTVVGFPLGAGSPKTKAFEAELAVSEGAREVDMVINIGLVKEGNYKALAEDVRAVVQSARKKDAGILVKAIIETCLLSEAEKTKVCETLLTTGADFVKTSTGFSAGGATIADVKLIKGVVGDKMKIKASGGIRTAQDALAMIAAGADRLGSSSGVAILKDFEG